jgi:acyl-CoA reductase-like NAD-dependent aldehyde dehydrogenase
MQIINPANGKPIVEIQADQVDTVERKFQSLAARQQQWRSVPLEHRIQIIKKFSELLEKNTERLSAILTSEVGKPLQQSRNEINGARSRISWLTGNASKFLSDETMTSDGDLKEIIRYEPLGVVCNISAWNYPYLVGVNVFVPALLAGNSVMYKPSEYATLTGIEIKNLLLEAGVPDNAFEIAVGDRSVGELLLNLPFQGYFFTGSYRTGKYIYERVASKMVPCQCELGGKDPLYVADDISDIKAVAAATADGAFYNNGQSCCAVERIYVHHKIYDRYISEFVQEVKSWKIGNPTDAGVYIGPLSRKAQIGFIEEQIKDAVQKGASVVTGGKAIPGDGFFFEPTVLTNVNHQMSVMREESFGPIIGIMKVNSDAEALQFMQDTPYGLTASVYSSNGDRARKILDVLNTGTGYWNCCDRVSAAVPWSGRGHSGFGSTLSHAGIRAFTKPKAFHLRG